MKTQFEHFKSESGEIFVEVNCKTCEFNFGEVCAGHSQRPDNGETTYGMPMEKAYELFPNGCEDYGISLDAFIEQEMLNGR